MKKNLQQKRSLKIVFLSLSLFLSISTYNAQTSIVVNSLADNTSAGTLRWAIGQANATAGGIYDEITFSVTGSIVLTSQLPAITQSLTITGPGQDNLSIDGNNLYRTVNNTAAISINFSNITLKKGLGSNGGIINNQNGTFTFTNVKFSQMSAGSAFFQNNAGVSTFNNCLFTGLFTGTACDYGGTPASMSTNDANYPNRMYFNTCSFVSNTNGIFNYRFTKITNCTFTNNTQFAAYITGVNRYQVYTSTFTGNGTAIYTKAWIPTTWSMGAENQLIENNVFLNNTTAVNLDNSWNNGTTVYNGVSSNSVATVRTNCFSGNGTNIAGVSGYASPGNTFVTLAAITGFSSVCLGSTITLANSTSGGTWSSSNTAIATVNSSGVVTPIAAGTAVISYSMTGACANASTTKSITINAPSFNTTLATGNFVWLGTTSTDWATISNWSSYNGSALIPASAIPSATDVTIVPLNGTCVLNQPTLTSGTVSTSSIIIESNATLSLGTATLNVTGNFTNNGTFSAGTGTVQFNGTSLQSLTGSASFYNLTLNNSAGLTLNSPVTITNNLTMTIGNISNVSNLLTLGASSADPGSLTYVSGSILGKLKRYFSAAATTTTGGLFPVGTAAYNRFAKVNFTSSPGTNQFLTVEYKTGAPLNASNAPLYAGLPTTIAGQIVQVYSADGYWQIDPTDNNYTSTICSAPYNLSLYANNLTNFNNPSTVRIIKAAGSNISANHHVSWQGAGTHTVNATTSSTAAEISSTNCTGFSWYNVGTWNDQALPVELTSFTAECSETGTLINWQTASEHTSSAFEIEKSRDGMNWMNLTTVAAAGNSTALINYSFTDAEKSGVAYYRLQQVDQDGTAKTYGPISSNCSNNGISLKTFPNPSSELFTISIESEEPMTVAQIILKDVFGRVVASKAVSIVEGTTQVELSNLNLQEGVYTVSLEENGKAIYTVKQVMQ